MIGMKIHHVAISVTNLERSVQFYSQFFGFKEIKRYTKPGWEGESAILAAGDVELEIFGFKDYIENENKGTDLKRVGLNHLGIEVGNVQETYTELKKEGVDISDPRKGTTCTAYCFLRDPDGISIELYQR